MSLSPRSLAKDTAPRMSASSSARTITGSSPRAAGARDSRDKSGLGASTSPPRAAVTPAAWALAASSRFLSCCSSFSWFFFFSFWRSSSVLSSGSSKSRVMSKGGRPVGYTRCKATGAFTTSSRALVPASRMSALWPVTGAVSAAVIPLARATAIASLLGFTATQARASALTSRISRVSTLPGTLWISTRPMAVRPSMRPG